MADELQELCRSKTHLSAGLTLHTVDFKYTWEHQSAARRPLGGERKGFGAFRKDLLPNDNYRLSLARASFAFFGRLKINSVSKLSGGISAGRGGYHDVTCTIAKSILFFWQLT